MPKIKINNIFCFKLIIVSIFIFSYPLREKFIPALKDVNILFFSALSLLIIINYKLVSYKKVLAIMALMIFNILINLLTNARISNVLYFNIQTLIPLLLLTIDFEKVLHDNYKNTVKSVVDFFNLFIHIFFIIFLIDLVTNNWLSRLLASTLTVYSSNWIPQTSVLTRYRFFFAHPLYTSVLVMTYYLLNIICKKNKIKTKVSYWTFHVISMILIFSTGSKAPIVLFIIVFYLFNYTPQKLIAGISAMVALYISGGMDFILNRFLNETSLTSGRNEALIQASQTGLIKIHLFTGYGENLQYILTDKIGILASAAVQEYPTLVFILRYGIIFAIAVLFFLVILPLIRSYKAKSFSIFVGISTLFLQINMFNGLTSLVEVEIIYVFFLTLCLHILALKKEKEYDYNLYTNIQQSV